MNIPIITAILSSLAFMQQSHAVQIEWTGSVASDSYLPVLYTLDAGYMTPLSMNDGSAIEMSPQGQAAYDTQLDIFTDDTNGNLSFNRISFNLPEGSAIFESKLFEIPPSGFGQPPTTYTVNIILDKFSYSVVQVPNSFQLNYLGNSIYEFPPVTGPWTPQITSINSVIETFALGGRYEVVYGSDVLSANSFDFSPFGENTNPFLEIIGNGQQFDLSNYPESIVHNTNFTRGISSIYNFDDVTFIDEIVTINGQQVPISLAFTDVTLVVPESLTFTPIPEPSTITLFAGIALCTLVFLKRKRTLS